MLYSLETVLSKSERRQDILRSIKVISFAIQELSICTHAS